MNPVPALSVSPKPESTYVPMASSLELLVAAVAPEEMLAAPDVVPLLEAI